MLNIEWLTFMGTGLGRVNAEGLKINIQNPIFLLSVSYQPLAEVKKKQLS